MESRPVRLGLLALLLLVFTPPPATTAPARRDDPATVTVELDSGFRQVVMTIGPLHVPAGMAMDHHDPMMMAMMQDSCIGQFDWPRTALFHGLRLELLDAQGRPLPRAMLHHLTLYNLDRRQLVYPLTERIVGFGQETENISVPASVGMPMIRGHRVAVVVMWNNESGHDLENVRLRLTFKLNPRRQTPAPRPVLPFMADANLVPGGINVFDVPPGGVTRDFEFTVPISGRLLAVGGHLHDHGAWVRLEDASTRREIATVRPIKDAEGHVVGMTRQVLALLTDGPKLVAGHRYRLRVRYENPGRDTLPGMMGLMGGLFAPDDMRAWPAIDRTNADYLADRADIRGARLDP